VAGETDAALRRVVRLGAHWFPFNIEPERLAQRRADLARLLEAAGRSIDDVHITAGGPNRASAESLDLSALAEAGADQVVLRIPPTLAPEAVPEELDALARAAGF
jgi:alkanesulfonate monooxygenase SsuD/methylene tetrahydromethanopterin reductase-like flavin-dependent oxidoreductase (luciferase family)